MGKPLNLARLVDSALYRLNGEYYYFDHKEIMDKIKRVATLFENTPNPKNVRVSLFFEGGRKIYDAAGSPVDDAGKTEGHPFESSIIITEGGAMFSLPIRVKQEKPQ